VANPQIKLEILRTGPLAVIQDLGRGWRTSASAGPGPPTAAHTNWPTGSAPTRTTAPPSR